MTPIQCESIESIEYKPAGVFAIGRFRVVIEGDTAPVLPPVADINTISIAAGRGRGMRTEWDSLVEAIESRLAGRN